MVDFILAVCCKSIHWKFEFFKLTVKRILYDECGGSMGYFSKIFFLIGTNAPLYSIKSRYILKTKHRFLNRFSVSGKKYTNKMKKFRFLKNNLKLNADWFSQNIPTWLRAIDQTDLREKNSINYLEIGSWQGLSAFFILNELPNSQVVCVDTWAGGDEHIVGMKAESDVKLTVEEIFDNNLIGFKHRIDKFKGTSLSFFAQKFLHDIYDIIYVDGSHHSDDVIVDAVKCFEMLREGGLLIFDDYFWKYYEQDIDNPAGAINAFLRLKHKQLEILCFDYQIIVRKKASSSRWR